MCFLATNRLKLAPDMRTESILTCLIFMLKSAGKRNIIPKVRSVLRRQLRNPHFFQNRCHFQYNIFINFINQLYIELGVVPRLSAVVLKVPIIMNF